MRPDQWSSFNAWSSSRLMAMATMHLARKETSTSMLFMHRSNRGRGCAGMPGCHERACQRTRMGQSRCCERRIAVVAITVAVVRMIVSVSMRVPVRMLVVIASVHVCSMTMWWRCRGHVPVRVCVWRCWSSSCHYRSCSHIRGHGGDCVVTPGGSQGEEKTGGAYFL